MLPSSRSMAAAPGSSAGPSGGSSRWYRPAYGFHPHAPALHHRWGAKILGGTMFFWIFYRAYHDGPVLLGWKHPWDGHHGHDDHSHESEHH